MADDQQGALDQQAQAQPRAAGYRWPIGDVSYNLGVLAWYQGGCERAEALLRENLIEARAVGSPHGLGMVVVHLGLVALDRGEYAQALPLLREGLTLAQSIGHLGRLVRSQGDPQCADARIESQRPPQRGTKGRAAAMTGQ